MHLGELHEAAKSTSSTWHNVPESDGGEGDEAKVEGSEEAPILPLFRLSQCRVNALHALVVDKVSDNYCITYTRLLDLLYHLCMWQLIPG